MPYELPVIEGEEIVQLETEPEAIDLIEKPEEKQEITEILPPKEEVMVKQAKKPAKKKENQKDKQEVPKNPCTC